ncbi:MAG: GatB/YqeY domain-containing protein [Candidatus Omnitrophica bacterium]|nr:GatB/YqeY domain-containing protein [Candidatus Omnitrophota bacterium]MDD5437085.1 GatB/YqeY domain-containing protein [Candidatus Omnitrophota bacterium]
MSFYERLEGDARKALKEGDTLRLSVLRMALSAIKTLQIEKNIKSMDDDSVIQILQRQAKQHRESIEQFTKGSRPDLAGKESSELKILEGYLPKQLSEDELMVIVKAAVTETGAATKADTGRLMKAIMEKAKGKADGKTINKLIQGLLK